MGKHARLRIASGLFALIMAGAIAAPAQAQYIAEFTPFFTSYYPLTNVSDAVGGDATVQERQTNAPGAGASLTIWISNTIGIEGAGSFVFSGTRFKSDDPDAGAVGVSLPGNLITGTGRIVFRPARTNLYLLAGGGVVVRGGDTWDFDFITKKTSIGGVVGFGARANVTPKLALNVTVEGMFYSLDPDGSDGTVYESKMQADIHVKVGIPIGFGRR
jgi:hypothetical protein